MRNQSAYKDGYMRGQIRGSDVNTLKRAISDCGQMGWSYLGSYFQGQLDAVVAQPVGDWCAECGEEGEDCMCEGFQL